MALKLKEFMTGVEVKESLVVDNLALYPLTCGKAEEKEPLSYLLLEEALSKPGFVIGEVSEDGEVNTVLISNMTGMAVLILDGEEILGAKQNRMVNATVLIPADKEIEIPVSCVERGRWRYSSEKFNRSGSFGYSTLRRQKAEQVHSSLQQRQVFEADQGAIWDEIDRKQATMGCHSETDALHDVYDNLEEDIKRITLKLKAVPDQCGLVVFINNRFACLDLFDQPLTLSRLWDKLIKSYAVEAIEAMREKSARQKPDPAGIKSAIAGSDCIAYPSVGLGRDLRLTGAGIIGAGLALEDRIIHLSVFERDAEEQREPNSHISRPSCRRRNIY